MVKALFVILTAVVTSLYFFPFEFTFLPGMNTKMLLAAVGLVLVLFNVSRERKAQIDKDFFVITLWGLVVSLICFAAVVLNNTADYTYATYFISMWVWLGGAYTVTQLIKAVHGRATVRLVAHYLITVCAVQCIIAFAMGQYPPLKQFVDSFLASEGFMGRVEDRLYGIGASLDVGGMRFAAILFVIAYLSLSVKQSVNIAVMTLYVMAFTVIAIVGNMIGRTAIIGVVLALCYWLMITLFSKKRNPNVRTLWATFGAFMLVFLPIVIYLYNTDAMVRTNIRFAFEGFFSLVETGQWEVHSNDILSNMYVFPNNVKTWLIGDGYFDNPLFSDPYYTGRAMKGFYMDTDVGYLRFIFYFGVFGLLAFILYMYQVARVCASRFPDYKLLFGVILLLNYLVWFKVSSDLFLFFALFLCVKAEQEATSVELQTAQR